MDIPSLPNTPPNPPVLVSQDCVTGVVLSSGAWDTDPDHPVTYVNLYRSDVVGPLHQFANDTDTWTDATALTPGTYHYTTRAGNDWGLSALPNATPLDVVTARSSGQLHVVLTASTNGTPASGIIHLLAQVSGSDTLDGAAPLDLLVNGVSLAGSLVRSDADPNQFGLDYDSAAARAVGAIVFSAIAKNNGGCKSVPASLTISIDNTLARTTAYEMFSRTALDTIVRAGAWARIIPAHSPPDASDRLWEFRVLSPAPSPLPDATDLSVMLPIFTSAQQWHLGTRAKLDGTALLTDPVTYTAPDNTMLLIGKRQPTEAINTYATGSNHVRKLRSVSDSDKIVFTTAAFNVLHFNGSGLTAVTDASGILGSLSAATDGAWLSDSEIHIVLGGQVYIADMDAGQVTLAATPVFSGAPETMAATFAEAAGGAAYWVYNSDVAARLYRYVAGASVLEGSLAAPVTLAYARGSTLLLVCDTKLYDGGLNLLYTHTASITALQIMPDLANAVQFADSSGRVYNLSGSVATLLNGSGAGFQANALGRFQGAFASVHGALGGADDSLYLQDGSGAYIPVAVFETGAVVTALERLLLTSGDLVDESLLVGVDKASSAGAYIARYQAVTQNEFMVRAQGVRDIVLEEIQ